MLFIDGEPTNQTPRAASDITFDNTATNLESTNVQSAIEEVNESLNELANIKSYTYDFSGQTDSSWGSLYLAAVQYTIPNISTAKNVQVSFLSEDTNYAFVAVANPSGDVLSVILIRPTSNTLKGKIYIMVEF